MQTGETTRTVATVRGSFLRATSTVRVVPLYRDLVVSAFALLDVAPPGASGMRCAQGHFFPPAEVWRGPARKCEKCGGRGQQERVGVTDAARAFVESVDLVRSTSWWHSTATDTVFDAEGLVPMHVGSKRAAIFRAQAMNYPSNRFKMWEFRVATEAAIAREVVMDNSNVDGRNALAEHVAESGVVRYINSREDEGSVSLLGHVSNFLLSGESEMDASGPVPRD